jgi:hypothetical protein
MLYRIKYIIFYTKCSIFILDEVSVEKSCAEQMRNEELDFKKLVKLRMKCTTDLWNYLKILNRKFFGIFEYKKLKHCVTCVLRLY